MATQETGNNADEHSSPDESSDESATAAGPADEIIEQHIVFHYNAATHQLMKVEEIDRNTGERKEINMNDHCKQGHHPCGSYDPYGGAYDPYSAGYDPYSAGYDPYSAGYDPYSAGYDPYSAGYDPYSSAGYDPYGADYSAYDPYGGSYDPYSSGAYDP
ncbi:MAG: hypothetical protein KGM95_09045, partial [Betaproteobacteria bacterium]|nr:hypothetical protein [Betaproteobacteria bacterium]